MKNKGRDRGKQGKRLIRKITKVESKLKFVRAVGGVANFVREAEGAVNFVREAGDVSPVSSP